MGDSMVSHIVVRPLRAACDVGVVGRAAQAAAEVWRSARSVVGWHHACDGRVWLADDFAVGKCGGAAGFAAAECSGDQPDAFRYDRDLVEHFKLIPTCFKHLFADAAADAFTSGAPGEA